MYGFSTHAEKLVSSEKQEKLRAVLASLPADMTARLCSMANEVDPPLGQLLAHCTIDADTAARARFFAPVAPLIRTPEQAQPTVSLGPPSLIDALWCWMRDEIAPDAVTYAIELAYDYNVPINSEELDAHRAAAADAMIARLDAIEANPKAGKRLQARLGVDSFKAVREVATLLRLAPQARMALKALPAVIDEPGESLCALIRDRYEAAVAAAPDAGPWVILLVMARFTRAWQILRVFEHLTKREDDLLAGSTEMAVIGDVLLRAADHHLSGFRRVPRNEDEARASAAELAAFSALTFGMTREIGIRKGGPWGQRIIALRTGASQQMSTIHDAAWRAFKRVLPNASPLRRRPQPPAPQDIDAATALCLFMTLTRDSAGGAAVDGAHRAVISNMTDQLERAGQAALDDLSVADVVARESIHASLEIITRLLTALDQKSSAMILLRRSAAARAA